MASLKEAVCRQRRRELDAKRGKSRIRLGSCLDNWDKLRKTLGFSLHSELAQYLLDNYFSKVCSRCSGDGNAVAQTVLSTTAASLQQLILLVHSHSQQCPLPPSLRLERDPKTFIQADHKALMQGDSSGVKQAGPTGVPQAGSTGVAHAGPTGVAQAGPTGVAQAGPTGVAHAGPTGVAQAGSKGCTQPGLKPTLHAEPQAFILVDPKGLTQAGPKGCTQPDPKPSLHADPQDSILAGSKGLTQAGLTGVTQVGPTGITQAGPKYCTQRGLKPSLHADPQDFILSGPQGLTQAGPKGCTQPGLKPALHADPQDFILAGPKALTQAGPKGYTQPGLKPSLHADPQGSIRAGSKGLTQAGRTGIKLSGLKPSLHADPQALVREVASPEGLTQAGPKDSIKDKPISSLNYAPKSLMQADHEGSTHGEPKSTQTEASLQAQMCLQYTCEAGHVFTWCLMQTLLEVEDTDEGEGEDVEEEQENEEAGHPAQKNVRKQKRRGAKEGRTGCERQEVASGKMTRSGRRVLKTVETKKTKELTEQEAQGGDVQDCSGEYEEPEAEEHMCLQEGSDAVTADVQHPSTSPASNEMNTENIENENQTPADREKTQSAVPKPTRRRRQRRQDPPETKKADNMRPERRKRNNRPQSVKDDVSQICGKRKRKAAPKLILPCKFNGCWKIFSSRQYLNHHMKYQHVQQKTFICSHPSCGKSFNFKKHLKEHEKLHSDQRDYICEFCARAFRTSSNLSIHRRIHTGEKPLQCEVCGYTCRQKASLNWHMRKHDAESSYLFPCEICGRRFEKRDNVIAHQSKSHPEHLTTSMDTPSLKPSQEDPDTIKPSIIPTSTEPDL